MYHAVIPPAPILVIWVPPPLPTPTPVRCSYEGSEGVLVTDGTFAELQTTLEVCEM